MRDWWRSWSWTNPSMRADRSLSGSSDSASASRSSTGRTNGDARTGPPVTRDRERFRGARNAARASALVLPGKREQHDQADDVGAAHVERAGVVGSLEFLQADTEDAADALGEHCPAFLAGQL